MFEMAFYATGGVVVGLATAAATVAGAYYGYRALLATVQIMSHFYIIKFCGGHRSNDSVISCWVHAFKNGEWSRINTTLKQGLQERARLKNA